MYVSKSYINQLIILNREYNTAIQESTVKFEADLISNPKHWANPQTKRFIELMRVNFAEREKFISKLLFIIQNLNSESDLINFKAELEEMQEINKKQDVAIGFYRAVLNEV